MPDYLDPTRSYLDSMGDPTAFGRHANAVSEARYDAWVYLRGTGMAAVAIVLFTYILTGAWTIWATVGVAITGPFALYVLMSLASLAFRGRPLFADPDWFERDDWSAPGDGPDEDPEVP